jgi:hypothetical protein
MLQRKEADGDGLEERGLFCGHGFASGRTASAVTGVVHVCAASLAA